MDIQIPKSNLESEKKVESWMWSCGGETVTPWDHKSERSWRLDRNSVKSWEWEKVEPWRWSRGGETVGVLDHEIVGVHDRETAAWGRGGKRRREAKRVVRPKNEKELKLGQGVREKKLTKRCSFGISDLLKCWIWVLIWVLWVLFCNRGWFDWELPPFQFLYLATDSISCSLSRVYIVIFYFNP